MRHYGHLLPKVATALACEFQKQKMHNGYAKLNY